MIDSVILLQIPDVKLITPVKHEDKRGFFSEAYSKRDILENGIDINFVQDNHSLSKQKHVLRGLHFQNRPNSQDKLVRVLKGSILDVAVDLRANSMHFGKWVSAVIDEQNWQQILVPKGFAHGFITLEENTEVFYKTSDYYAPESDSGIAWNDPILNIDWGIDESQIILSDKDKNLPNFDPNKKYF